MDDKILAVVDGRACYIRESEDGGKIEMLPDEPPEITKGIKYSSRSEAWHILKRHRAGKHAHPHAARARQSGRREESGGKILERNKS